jgi:polyhydroxybutyrate depolymerase
MARSSGWRTRRWLPCFLSVAAIGLTVAQPAHAADGSATLVVDGAIRSYAIHVPDRARRWADFRSFWPSMAGMQGQGMRRLTHLDRQADARGVIIVYPDGLDRHWNDGRSTIRNPHDDVGFVSALLDRIGRDYRIDAGRIYATGISNGALSPSGLAATFRSALPPSHP